jgi:hypothetical protein
MKPLSAIEGAVGRGFALIGAGEFRGDDGTNRSRQDHAKKSDLTVSKTVSPSHVILRCQAFTGF